MLDSLREADRVVRQRHCGARALRGPVVLGGGPARHRHRHQWLRAHRPPGRAHRHGGPRGELELISASYDTEYLAYQIKYESIHGRYDGTIEVGSDSLIIHGHKVALSHTRNPEEIPF